MSSATRAGMVVLVGCLQAAAGCSGSGAKTDSGDGGPTGPACLADDIAIEVGTGELEFLPLASGEAVTMIHGPQGGWHVWTAVSVEHSEPEVSLLAKITVPSMDLDLTEGAQPSFVALIYDDATCEGEFAGLRAYLGTEGDGAGGPSGQDLICALDGVAMTLEVTLQDLVSGRTASASAEVTASLDTVDQDACAE